VPAPVCELTRFVSVGSHIWHQCAGPVDTHTHTHTHTRTHGCPFYAIKCPVYAMQIVVRMECIFFYQIHWINNNIPDSAHFHVIAWTLAPPSDR